jgi:hypothetical protein
VEHNSEGQQSVEELGCDFHSLVLIRVPSVSINFGIVFGYGALPNPSGGAPNESAARPSETVRQHISRSSPAVWPGKLNRNVVSMIVVSILVNGTVADGRATPYYQRVITSRPIKNLRPMARTVVCFHYFFDCREGHALVLVSVSRLTGHAHRPAQHQEADSHDPTPSDADGDARPRDTHRGGLSGQERHHDKQRDRNASGGNLTGRCRLWELEPLRLP